MGRSNWERMTLEDITRYKSVFIGPPPLTLIGLFDVIKFDDILHDRFGYSEEEHGSMNDFITMKWGAEFCSFMKELYVKILDYESLKEETDGKA